MRTKIKALFYISAVFLTPLISLAATSVGVVLLGDATWTKENSPYVINAYGFSVPQGVTLTLEPGTVVKIPQSNTTINIEGNISAIGTETDPIYFTALNDSTIGGDTGHSEWGDSWGGFTVGKTGQLNFSRVNIKKVGNALSNNGIVHADHTVFGNAVSNYGDLDISHSVFENGVSYALNHGAGTTTVISSDFRNKGNGFVASGSGTLTLSDNTFEVTDTLGDLNMAYGLLFKHSNNTATGSGRNGFFVHSGNSQNFSDQKWTRDTIPYVITYLNFSIPSGRTLTLSPGTVVKFEQNNASLTVNGSLVSQGTKVEPVVFTSLDDSTVGGNTLQRSPSPWYTDSWAGISLEKDSTATFDYTIFRNGGYFGGAILNNGGTLFVKNSEVAKSQNYGVYHVNGATTISQSSFYGTSREAVRNYSLSGTVDAKNNWWGSKTGPKHADNPNGTGDSVSDRVDFFPFLTADPKMSPVFSFSDVTETEDDGVQDGKGVAGKTIFSFSASVIGAKNVTLWVNNGVETKSYALSSVGETYVFSSTFPKGRYGYHYEADNGAARFPENGELKFTAGYSNVAFLPGIKASRLFKQKNDCFFTCEDQLWEPNWWTDTQDISLNPDGTSADKNIYIKTDPYLGMIDQANILPFPDIARENFYAGFIDFMNTMVANKEIAEWKALPYDWRLAFLKILSNGTEINGNVYYDDSYSTTSPYILQELRHLAETSDTGKVTIIAHSMGGLLAKKLLNDNGDISENTDTLILVDVPQLGTAQAVATFLHGTKEDLPYENFGLFTDDKIGRKVAQNMKSAYTLLPSKEYLSRVKDENQKSTAVISQNANLQNFYDALFNGSSVLNYYRQNYGTTTINTYEALADFLGGRDGHFSSPDNDMIHPKRIQMDMLLEAERLHDEIDTWVPPQKMRVVQIAGWGIPDTIKGIEYRTKEISYLCAPMMLLSCHKTIFDVVPVFTFDGDGTVVSPSQTAMNTETYWVDLNGYNSYLTKDRSHGSILEVKSVRDLIENILQKTNNPGYNLEYIKTAVSQLDKSNLGNFVRLSLHSPVNVDITDGNGKHVGISASSTSERIFSDTEMPNSYYLEMGEGKYVGFPLGKEVTIELQGTDSGTFTLNLQQVHGDTVELTQTFSNIPVTASTKASLTINTINDAKELALDQNGDGLVDAVAFTEETKKDVTFQTLRNEVQALPLKEKKELLREVDSAEKQFIKSDYKETKEKLLELKKEVGELSGRKGKEKSQIENIEVLRISEIIKALLSQIEKNIQAQEDLKKKHEREKEDDRKKSVERRDKRE